MLPSELRKAAKIGVRGDHGATVFQRDRGMPGVRDQLASGPRDPAQPLENDHAGRPTGSDRTPKRSSATVIADR